VFYGLPEPHAPPRRPERRDEQRLAWEERQREAEERRAEGKAVEVVTIARAETPEELFLRAVKTLIYQEVNRDPFTIE
jgi:hypothetical protein